MKSNIDMSLLNKKAIVWVADYNKSLTYQGDYDIWQYSSKGEIKGIGSQYVDTNTWNKKSFKKFT
jgi:GH25 family lysozyme M1 (1,4-beta-N-acetylmuramidase)